MPISGGTPGLTFNFEREVETIPGLGNLVLGDSKILTCGQATGTDCEIERQHNAGNWDQVRAPDNSAINCLVNIPTVFGYISTETAQWRVVNTNAADREIRLSVINVG